MNETVLVTGSAGYVGSHTVVYLKDQGYRAIGLDNLSRGLPDLAPLADVFLQVDLLDYPAVRRVFKDYPIDAIVHCAALAVVSESVEQPEEYYRINVGGTANLLKAARNANVTRLVFSSTAATYGLAEADLLAESSPTRPINPYGASKLAAEALMRAAAVAWGFRPVIFRYFNAAGADPKGRTGEDHQPETHLIPIILKQLAEGRGSHVTIFGTDYPTPDGTCIRDYIHVMDLAAAHKLGIQHSRDLSCAEVFNLGTSHGYSVREVIEAIQRITNRSIVVELGNRRPGDPARLVTSNKRANEHLGWTPVRSSLDNIIETAWAWHARRHAVD